MNDFFNLPDETVSTTSQSKGYEKKVDTNIYDPNPDSTGGGVYKSIFRFIPNLRDKNESKYTKYSAKIWNPVAKKSIVVDCPSNENKPSVLWTLSSILGRLYKEEPTVVKEINENFSRWYTHHSYVYIANDPQSPEFNGSIKILKYRAQINDLIENQMNPDEDGLLNVKKVNPFHLLEGKDFVCVVSKKGKQWRDWTKCKFMDEVTPFRFKIKDNEVTMKNEEGAIKLITEFFNKTAPALDEYRHISWTEETYVQVAEALKAAIPYKQVLDMLISETRDEKMKALLSNGSVQKTTEAPSAPVAEDTSNDDFFSTSSTSTSTQDTSDESESSLDQDEYDDIFKNL